MSHMRPDDLDVGVAFEVSALGTVSLGQPSNVDLMGLQKHLRELYLAHHRPTGTQPLPQCCLVVSNRGLAVTDAAPSAGCPGRLPTPETLYNIPSVTYAAAVKFVMTGKKEKDFRFAFDAIDSESPAAPKGKNDLYVGLDKKSRHLAKVTSHSAICACVIQRMTGVKASELHAFVCQSDDQARDVIARLTTASRNFAQKENHSPVYGQGLYDLPRSVPAANGGGLGLNNIQPQRPSNEDAHGLQGCQEHGSPGGQRGPEFQKPSTARSEMNGGGHQDLKSPGAWSVQGNEGPQGSGLRVSEQRDQLIRTFQEDQRRKECLRSGPEQPGVQDAPAQKSCISDSQTSKATHESQPSVYEYRPQQQTQAEPSRSGVSPQSPEGQQRGIYDSSTAVKGNPVSAERLVEEPARSPDGSKGFTIPRSKVSYDHGQSEPAGKGQGPVDHESFASGRPVNLGNETGGRAALPASSLPSPKNEGQTVPDTTLERKAKKAQPPPPVAKPRQPSATSPTTETTPRGPLSGGNHPLEPQLPPSAPERMAAPRKVPGVKVFPTIILRGAQVQAAASAVDDDDDDDDDRRCNSSEQQPSKVMENFRTIDRQSGAKKRTQQDQVDAQEASKKDREIEGAEGDLPIEQ